MFFHEKSEAYNYLNHTKQILNARYLLDINIKKSGVFESKDITYLGYTIIENKGNYEITKYKREKLKYYSTWYSSPLTYNHHQYHILDDGILRKKDFHILFENDDQKVEIPVEVTDHINIHSDIIFSSSFFEVMNTKKIAVNIFNKQGIYLGQFTPNNKTTNIYTTLNQSLCYQDKNKRLNISKKFVNASIHNERAIIKYYYKKTNNQKLNHSIEKITNCLKQVNECKTYEELLLIEARAKHIYYQTIPNYITNPDFHFDQRSKQPPLNNINALISFGNTVLYNLIANEIQKTSLDIRIGFLHASNARKQSLNLDFADVFKPIIIDRVIFTMIHKNIITNKHFENREHGIYLTKEGKSIFIKYIYKKLYSHITINNEKGTYYTIIRHNIYSLLQHINKEQKLKLYKYQ